MLGVFGTIDNPLPSSSYGDVGSGLPNFISNVVKVVFIAGGLYAFFNLFFAGFTYLTAGGDKQKLENALSSINMSLIGLLVMVGSGLIIGLASYLFYGDPTAILNPTITGPGTP